VMTNIKNGKTVFMSVVGVVAIIVLSFSMTHAEKTQPRQNSLFYEAMLARQNGNRIKAERLWKEAIQKDPNSDGASALCLGDLMKDEGRLAEAEPLLKQALDIDIKLFGSDSLEISTPMCQLAALYEQEGRLLLAQGLLTDVARICAKSPERERAALQNASALNALARVYIAEGHPELVTPALKQSRIVYQRLLDKSNPSRRNLQQFCASACNLQNSN
jgi:tetratricopeptide (TPR) repeat protein